MTHTVFKKNLKGIITGTQRFCLNDGPGIRTVVFMKGCPLACLWCHNPETQVRHLEILYDERKCVGCGACANICPQCHSLQQGIHVFSRNACNNCGKCVDACPGALEKCGVEITVDEIMEIIRADRLFYQERGGLTLSGGEPFYQSDFSQALLYFAQTEGFNCTVETCGTVKTEILLEAAKYVELFLYDVKETDSKKHKELTGSDNQLILYNLETLSKAGSNIILRVPVIPGANDSPEHFQKVGELAERLKGVQRVEVLPYHRAGNNKYGKLDRSMKEFHVPTNEECVSYIKAIQQYTSKTVKRG